MTHEATIPQAIQPLLDELYQANGSDLHLRTGEPPKLRLHGEMTTAAQWQTALGDLDAQALITDLIPNDERRVEFEDGRQEVDFAFEMPGKARFRVNAYWTLAGRAAVIRLIPQRIPELSTLGLPEIVRTMATRPRGLVLVVGPTGSGKSTTLASILDFVNQNRHGHIITIEDPIEFVHHPKNCTISQREVRSHTKSFETALRFALREDPDVLLVGEMRDLETIRATLTLAETGHLVFATLHTHTAADTIQRIINAFPGEQQPQVRTQLAGVLECVVAQALVRGSSISKRLLATEVMIVTPSIRPNIRDGKTDQIYSQIQLGREHGMRTFNESLYAFITTGHITPDDAYRISPNPGELRSLIESPRANLGISRPVGGMPARGGGMPRSPSSTR
ncbi:MAG: type IV pilus twitching motility protein PilT [Gemmatimonadaceae bacterium]